MRETRKDRVGCPMIGTCNYCVHPCGFTPKEIKDIENNESINAELLRVCKDMLSEIKRLAPLQKAEYDNDLTPDIAQAEAAIKNATN